MVALLPCARRDGLPVQPNEAVQVALEDALLVAKVPLQLLSKVGNFRLLGAERGVGSGGAKSSCCDTTS